MWICYGRVLSFRGFQSYGVRTARPFIAGVHSKYLKVERIPGQCYCNNICRIRFFTKVDEAGFDDCVNLNCIWTFEWKTRWTGIWIVFCRMQKCMSSSFQMVGLKKKGTRFMVGIPNLEEVVCRQGKYPCSSDRDSSLLVRTFTPRSKLGEWD